MMKDEIEIKHLFDGVKTVSDITNQLLLHKQPDIKTTHSFNGGMYCRTFYPEKNTLVVGKIHKFAGFNVLLKGSVTIYDGHSIKTIKAPYTWEAPANAQKVGFFHEDSVFSFFSTCFSNNIEEAEKELFYSDEITIEQVNDWLDYNKMLFETGMSESDVQRFVQLENMIETSGLKDFELKDSNIHGKGFFTTRSYKKGEFLGMALIDGKRTELGRWVNNSSIPNTCSLMEDVNNGKVLALRDIKEGEEITISYIENIRKQREQL